MYSGRASPCILLDWCSNTNLVRQHGALRVEIKAGESPPESKCTPGAGAGGVFVCEAGMNAKMSHDLRYTRFADAATRPPCTPCTAQPNWITSGVNGSSLLKTMTRRIWSSSAERRARGRHCAPLFHLTYNLGGSCWERDGLKRCVRVDGEERMVFRSGAPVLTIKFDGAVRLTEGVLRYAFVGAVITVADGLDGEPHLHFVGVVDEHRLVLGTFKKSRVVSLRRKKENSPQNT